MKPVCVLCGYRRADELVQQRSVGGDLHWYCINAVLCGKRVKEKK